MPKMLSKLGHIKRKIQKSIEGKRWGGINDIVNELRAAGVFDEDFTEEAVNFVEKALVREVMRMKGDDDYPLFPNFVMTDPKTGKKKNVYMREKYMKPPEYVQVSKYWIDYEHKGREMANETLRRCNIRYNTQYELPFVDRQDPPDVPDIGMSAPGPMA